MSDERDAVVLQQAAASVEAATQNVERMQDEMSKVFIDRAEADRRHTRIMRVLAGMAAVIVLMAGLLVYVTRWQLLPLAHRNADNLETAKNTLAIVERVTGPEASSAGEARLNFAICVLRNEIDAIHDDGTAPGCSPAELDAIRARMSPTTEAP